MSQLLRAGVTPDGDEARRWAEEELQKAQYQDAKPSWFDYLVRNVVDFFLSLFSEQTAGAGGGLAIVLIIAALIVALLVLLFFFGRPRARLKRRTRSEHALLGEDDTRSAAELRTAAEAAARSADWSQAIILRYRALARSLWERDLIDPAPGATAQAIAREAGDVFPTAAAQISHAAQIFDDVRYRRTEGTEALYQALSDTDQLVLSLQLVSA